jgi:hypothetical protein
MTIRANAMGYKVTLEGGVDANILTPENRSVDGSWNGERLSWPGADPIVAEALSTALLEAITAPT